MDWIGVGKHSFTFGSTIFDIGSDIANSLNFLGVWNNDTYNSSTSLSITNITHSMTANLTLPLTAANGMKECAMIGERQDLIWGILSLMVVFLPGAFLGVSEVLKSISDKNWCRIPYVLIPGIPLLAVVVPFWLLSYQLLAIVTKCQKKEVTQKQQLLITKDTGFE